jgi:hypothetical protein
MAFIDPDEPRPTTASSSFKDPDEVTYGDRLKRTGGALLRGFFRAGPMGAALEGVGAGLRESSDVLDKAAYKTGGAVTDFAAQYVDPENAARLGFAANVGVQAIPTVMGAVAGKIAAKPTLERTGRRLMQSALKPTIHDLKTHRAAKAIDTMLDEGISPTQRGVEKLQSLVDDLNDEVAQAIQSSTATVKKGDVGLRLSDTWERFRAQVNPDADMGAIKKAWLEFRNHPLLAGKQDVPVQLAQKLKSGTYTQLKGKYGELGSADIEAQKALARGLKEEISAKVPDIASLNARESALINALEIAERRALLQPNLSLLGMSPLAHSPVTWAAFMADRSAAIKALAARGLYSGSGVIPTTAGGLGGGYLGILSGKPPQEDERGPLAP